MVGEGMTVGSHTLSHPVLAGLPFARQVEELRHSRRILQERLGRPIETIAYPFGSADSINADTCSALAEAGYRAAFSCYGGVNRRGRTDRSNVLRIGVEPTDDLGLVRLRVASATFTAKWSI